MYLILDNIRSVHNVGSVFRTADAFGVKKIFLVGTTPTPLDRFGVKRSDVAKVALGAEETVDWEHTENVEDVIAKLQSEGVHVFAVEQSKKSEKLGTEKRKDKAAYVFGNEVNGISEEILEKCNSVLEIPMKGTKESLNVSVTAGIVLFEVTEN